MNILRELFIENSKREFLNAVEKKYPNNNGLVEYIQNMSDADILYNHFDLPEPKTITEKISNLIESNKILNTNKDYFKNSKIYYVLEDIIYEEIINILEDMDFNKVYETVMKGLKGVYKGDIPEGVQKKIAKKIVDAKKAGHDTEKASNTILKKFKKYAASPGHRFQDRAVSGSRGSNFHSGTGRGTGGFGPDFHKAWEDVFGETFGSSQAKWAKGEQAGRGNPFGAGFKSSGASFSSRSGAGFRSAGTDFGAEYAARMAKFESEMAHINKIATIVSVSFLVLFLIAKTWGIYQSFFGIAQKSCKKKFPKNKAEYDKCVKNFKNKAKIQRINHLQKGKLLCKKTKNPKQCEQKINQKIWDVKKTMR
jgi:uncharacterized protein (UPF0335 family)